MTGIRDSSEKLIPKVHASQAREPHSCETPRLWWPAEAAAERTGTLGCPAETGRLLWDPGGESRVH